MALVAVFTLFFYFFFLALFRMVSFLFYFLFYFEHFKIALFSQRVAFVFKFFVLVFHTYTYLSVGMQWIKSFLQCFFFFNFLLFSFFFLAGRRAYAPASASAGVFSCENFTHAT
jgi:hypothetical protein